MTPPRGSTGAERLRQLMMAAVDKEITAAEQVELDAAIADDPALAAELDGFRRLRDVTGTVRRRPPPPEVWDGYWDGVYRRLERGFAWILASLGATVVAVWGSVRFVQEVLSDTDAPLFIRWSILALSAGLVILFVSVARERWFVGRTDPYKDVVR